MKYFKESIALVIKCWCDEPEEGAINQAKNLARLPFAFKQICLMPDVHQGYGMPIGGVLATQKIVVPNAVGVDIACGVCAAKTPWKVEEISIESLKKIMGKIREVIPVGFNHHNKQTLPETLPMPPLMGNNLTIVKREYENARTQLGTLGGGNHFIEIQKDTDNNVWVMLHSGSRNIGYKVAKYYNELAMSLNSKWFAYVPKEWELAFLSLDSQEGVDYMEEMTYCVNFALANRKLMMERIVEIFHNVIKHKKIDISEMINIAHNYARMENHFGQNVLVHRKGATSAKLGEIGIIPGSQGTSSYIVKGKGNVESFMSCSHGAGRCMGRKEAQKTLNLEEEQKKLNDKGILHAIWSKNDLDEAAGSYKDIDVVMEEQKDLVDILVKLEPLGVIKG